MLISCSFFIIIFFKTLKLSAFNVVRAMFMKYSFCLRTCIAVRLHIKVHRTQETINTSARIHNRILQILTTARLFLLAENLLLEVFLIFICNTEKSW